MAQKEIRGKDIFITGGTGFIGSWLIGTLIDDNRIWCYDNGRRFSPKVRELLDHRNMTFIKGDILDKGMLERSLPKGIDIVVHLAAIAGVSSYYDMPLETMKTNMIGTYNLLESLKDKKIGLLVDFSTSEVYGRYARNVDEEDDTVQGPISDSRWTYAISKLAAENLSHCYRRKYRLPVVSLRPFNIYGPFQIGEGAIHIFVRSALRDKDILIYGDGSQVRAWCYIEDLIGSVLSCIRNKEKVIGNVFNIGNPDARSTILSLARKIIGITKSNSKIRFKDETRTDIEYRVPDISKAKKMLNYSPSTGLTEGLKRTIAWYRENPV